MKKINVQTVTTSVGSITFRNTGSGPSTVEFTDRNGDTFQLDQEQAEGIFHAANSFSRMGAKAEPQPAKTTARTTAVTKPRRATAPHAGQARRYSAAEKANLIAGFEQAEVKSQFCRDNDVAVDTIKRWMRQGMKAAPAAKAE